MFWLFSGERVKIVSLVFQALFCPDLPGLKLAFPCNHQQATQQLLVSCLHILRQIVLQTFFVKSYRIILRNARQIAQFKYNFLEIRKLQKNFEKLTEKFFFCSQIKSN